MSKAFKAASQAVYSLVRAAHMSGRADLARQAKIVARMVQGLARLERQLQSEGRQFENAIAQLSASLKSGPRRPPVSGELNGYYVGMVGRTPARKGPRAADTGLIGRRVGRGPVSMGAGRAIDSTKTISAAFARLLSAQNQLQQLKSDIERLKRNP